MLCRRLFINLCIAAAAGFAATPAFATDFPETESNGTKATANVVSGMAPGDTLSGSTASASDLDIFDITTTTAPTPGIWQYRLTITTGTATTGTIRGRNQNANGTFGTTDTTTQSTTATFRYVEWYANDAASRIYFQMKGNTATVTPYVVTLTRSAITPHVYPGTVTAGPVSISTRGHTAVNTDMWLYNSDFTARVNDGNDAFNAANTQARLDRFLPAGTYIVAIAASNLANNLASPSDDAFHTGFVVDYPNVLLVQNSGATLNNDYDFEIDNRCDGSTSGEITNTSSATDPYEVTLWQFTTVDPAFPDALEIRAGAATPSAVGQGYATVLTATIGGGTPTAVTADLTAFGLSSAEAFHDDGINGDATPGDNIWTYTLTVPSSQTPSTTAYNVNVSVSGNPPACTAPSPFTIPVTVTPPNNTCAHAIPISIGSSTVGSTLGAAASGGGGTCNTVASTNPGVWYTFTEDPSTSHRLSANLCDPITDFDAQIVVYTGSCTTGIFNCIWGNTAAGFGCPTENPARNNGGTAHSDLPAIINWNPATTAPGVGCHCTIPGTTYYIIVLNQTAANGGHFVLHLDDTGETCEGTPSAHSTCANARPLSTFPYWDLVFRGDIAVGGIDVSCNDAANTESRGGIWYTYAPTQSGNFFHTKIPDQSTAGGSLDTVVTVFSAAPDCTALTEVACVDAVEGFATMFTTPVYHMAAGTTYYVMVSTFSKTAALPNGENIGFNFMADAQTSVTCCRGTTCLSIPAGSCTGVVAGSVSTIINAPDTCTGNSIPGCCYADYDHNGTKSIDDIFTYLNAWFARSPYAKVGGDGTATPIIDDIFAFLNYWFAGCH